jgi:hypothetical protein
MEIAKSTLKAEMDASLRIVGHAIDLIEALENVHEKKAVTIKTVSAIFKEWEDQDTDWKDASELERRTIVLAAYEIMNRRCNTAAEDYFRLQRIGKALYGDAARRLKLRRVSGIKKPMKPILKIVK